MSRWMKTLLFTGMLGLGSLAVRAPAEAQLRFYGGYADQPYGSRYRPYHRPFHRTYWRDSYGSPYASEASRSPTSSYRPYRSKTYEYPGRYIYGWY